MLQGHFIFLISLIMHFMHFIFFFSIFEWINSNRSLVFFVNLILNAIYILLTFNSYNIYNIFFIVIYVPFDTLSVALKNYFCTLNVFFITLAYYLLALGPYIYMLNIFFGVKKNAYLPCTMYPNHGTVRTIWTFSQKWPQLNNALTDPNVCCIKGSPCNRDSFQHLVFSLAAKLNLWEIFSH